jgi:hypothetical protein
LRFLLRQHFNRDVALLGLPNGFSAWMLLFRECMDDYMEVGGTSPRMGEGRTMQDAWCAEINR